MKKTSNIMPTIIDLIVQGKQKENVFCRVCGRDVGEVQKEIAAERVAEYIKEHEGKKIDEQDLERHKRWYTDRKHGKDCGKCVNLTSTECKEVIRVLRMRMEALEKKLRE